MVRIQARQLLALFAAVHVIFITADVIVERAAGGAAPGMAFLRVLARGIGKNDQPSGRFGKRIVELRGEILGKGGFDIPEPAADRAFACGGHGLDYTGLPAGRQGHKEAASIRPPPALNRFAYDADPLV